MTRQMKWWGWGAEDKSSDVSQMSAFWDFIEKNGGINSTSPTQGYFAFEDLQLSPVKEAPEFIWALNSFLKAEQISVDKLERLRHTYGKSYRDLLRFRLQKRHYSPDYILFPDSHEEVEKIVKLAVEHKVVLIPFGGGSNIVGAIERFAQEERTVVSLDLRRMKRLLRLDPISQTATFEAGVFGPDLEEQLAQHGFCLGHYPDSFEFSTLGGWLATRSAGMQSDRYGTIADMLLGLRAVSPKGEFVTKVVPKASIGPDLNQIILGSEGQYAVITEATMRIHPLPAQHAFRGVLFPQFAGGVEAIKRCAQEGCLPNAMRLIDSRETQLSFSFKSPSGLVSSFLEKGFKVYLRRLANFNFEQACLMILAFEGSKAEVAAQRRRVLAICRQLKGIDLGAKPGNRWYERKYDYPYLRDFIMNYGMMVDVVETSVTWANLLDFYEAVKQAIYAALAQNNSQDLVRKLLQQSNYAGYLGCHISHSYINGACLYFTFAAPQEQGKELEQYLAVKKAAIEAIIHHGGALSHHHSLGYEHSPWLRQEIGEEGLEVLAELKKALDPGNILNPGKFATRGERDW